MVNENKGPEDIRASALGMKTSELLKLLSTQLTILIRKEIALVKNEIKADIKTEIKMASWILVSLVCGFIFTVLFFVMVIFILANFFPGWISALLVTVVLLIASVITGLIGWSKRVRSPFGRIQHVFRNRRMITKEKMA